MDQPAEEIEVVDFLRVAEDIRKIPTAGRPPFLAGVMIAGLMIMDPGMEPYVKALKSKNLHLDNFEILCLLFYKVPALAQQFIDQIADHAAQGLFPEGEGQAGWNRHEFDVAINLLTLTLK